MQLTKTIFSDSAILIEKMTVENRPWTKSVRAAWQRCRNQGMGYGDDVYAMPSQPLPLHCPRLSYAVALPRSV